MYYFYDSYGNLAKIYRHTSSTTKKIYNVVTNSQGDVVAIYDFYGVLVCTYEYDAWGNLTFARDSAGNMITAQTHIAFLNPIRYRGYYYDSETGLYYLQSRYYDPNTGRFINADGYITTGQGVLSYNMYAYCMNNPVMYSDPSGEFFKEACRAVSEVVNQIRKKVTDWYAVTLTIYGEEHGVSMYDDWKVGQRAVAVTILNRKNANISYMGGDDLLLICSGGDFDGYYACIEERKNGEINKIAWDNARELALYVVHGDYDKIGVPSGMSQKHLYMNRTSDYQNNVAVNNGKFYFGPGTTPVDPKNVVIHGGNTFFYH